MMKHLIILAFFLAACTSQPVTVMVTVPVSTIDPRFAVEDAQSILATAERQVTATAYQATSGAATGTAIAQSTLEAAGRDATTTALAIAPVLTLGASTATAQYSTQIARETQVAFPVTVTAISVAASVEASEAKAAKEWQGAMTLFANVILILLTGFVGVVCFVLCSIIWRSQTFMDNLAGTARAYMELQVARAKLQTFDKEHYQIYNQETKSLELRRFDELTGPVVIDTGELDKQWRFTVWKFCEASAAAGSMAGEKLETNGVIANTDDGWRLLTDVMADAKILSKRERSRTEYAIGWNLDRVRLERDYLPLPHKGRLPPKVNWAGAE